MSDSPFSYSHNSQLSEHSAGSSEPRCVARVVASCATQSQSNRAAYQEPAIPPESNTGGKSLDQSQIAFNDWLAFTFIPPSAFDPLAWIKSQLVEVFDFPDISLDPSQRGWYGYKHRVDLGQYGLLAYGSESQRGSFHIELNAHACGLVSDWHKVKQWGETHDARITRLDLAHDDYEGHTVSIQQAIDWYEQGGFITAGRPPKRHLHHDFDSGDGKTFQVGERKNGKFCRIYEKGREQGDKSSPWVRVEVELHNKSRVIPWDAVINPGHFLAGAYPCLQFLSTKQHRIKTIQKSANITYSRMVAWLKESAGKAIYLMLEVNQGDPVAVVSQIVRPGRPRRLQHFEDFDINELILGGA